MAGDLDFKFDLGAPALDPFGVSDRAEEGLRPPAPAGVEIEYPKSNSPRGLALRSLTLKSSKEGWIQRLFNSPNELVVVSSSFDLSGQDPFIYPAKVEDVNGFRSVRKGETAEWTFGEGFPVALPRTIIGGLVVGLQVTESDEQSVRVAEALIAAAKEVKSDGGVKSLLQKLADPAKFAVDQALKALTEVSNIIGNVLKSYQKKMDPVALASGQFSAVAPWEGKLTQDLPDARLVLVETR
jgi:hypothetical protein